MKEHSGIIKAICISEKRGTPKEETDSALFIKGRGIENDAHAGSWHRQISLLPAESIEEFNKKGAGVKNGDFGENLIVSGIDLNDLPMGTTLKIGPEEMPVILKLTQRGKECHSHCRIHERMGECIMPVKGVFAEVLEGGTVKKGDTVTAGLPKEDRPFRAAVIVCSDKASKGEREDKSGRAACELLEEKGYEILECVIVPDEKEKIKNELIRLSDMREADLILTSGGTGFSLRDVTPEATMEIAERNAPGIAEYMRMKSAQITDRAMLSRGVSVIRKKTVIVNLPGSEKAVRECLGFIMNALDHGLKILRGSAGECGR